MTISKQNSRQSENYNPIINELQTIIIHFRHDLEKEIITAKIRNWISKYQFENYLPPIAALNLDLNISGSNYQPFLGSFGAGVTAATEKMSEIFMLPDASHDLKWLEVDGENRVMQIYAEPKDGYTDILNPKRSDVNDAFNLTIQANKDFLESVGGGLLQHAAERGIQFYSQVLETKIREMMQAGE